MLAGSEEQSSNDDSDLGSSSATFVPQFSSSQTLSPSQKDILQEYFDNYVSDGLRQFITVAPENLKPLRAYIITCASAMSPDIFQIFLNQFYPAVLPSSTTFEQNTYFKELLLNCNRLCKDKIDINHPLYNAIFDKRLSPSKMDSPTKKDLVASFFKRALDNLATPHMDLTNSFVHAARNWQAQDIASPATGPGSSPQEGVRRRLFF